MKVTNISVLRRNLFSFIDNVIENNDSITVSTKNGNVVIISETEYNAMLETIYHNVKEDPHIDFKIDGYLY